MKLSLNLPALERLIGGDTILELELRHQIVENFTKQYLKPLINDELMRKCKAELFRELSESLNQSLSALNNKCDLTDYRFKEIKQKWDNYIDSTLRSIIDEKVATILAGQAPFFERLVNSIAVTKITTAISQMVNDEIHKRLEKLKNA